MDTVIIWSQNHVNFPMIKPMEITHFITNLIIKLVNLHLEIMIILYQKVMIAIPTIIIKMRKANLDLING